MSLSVSTADLSTTALDMALEKLREASGKRAEILIRADVGRLILGYGGAILG